MIHGITRNGRCIDGKFQSLLKIVEKYAETNYKEEDEGINSNNLVKYACFDEGQSVVFRND